MHKGRKLSNREQNLANATFDRIRGIRRWECGKACERICFEGLDDRRDPLRSIVWVSRGDDIADDSETVQTAAVSRHSPMNAVKRIGRLDPRFQDIVSA